MATKKVVLSGAQKAQLERTDSLRILHKELRKFKQLSKEETIDLFQIYHNGNKKEQDNAFEKLCKHNMRLVISLARDYCSSDDNLNDLIQEGNIGLMKAIEMFDENNGTPFVGYAMYWIRRYINLFKTNYSPIVSQTNRSKTANVIVTISNDLWQKFERIPTPDEILDEYNLRYPKKPINDTSDLINVEYMYIDQIKPVNDSVQDLRGFYEYNAASMSHNNYIDEVEKDYNKKLVDTLLKGLTKKESQAIRMLYGIGSDFERGASLISEDMGVSNQRVSQLCDTAIKKMQKRYKELAYSKI